MQIFKILSNSKTTKPTNFGQANSSDKVKISVIVPIYNQERYLKRALDSLQEQSLKDTEFICINDGSKDNSLNILSEYANRDSRIKIINQTNQGVGKSRNNGLKIAKGEYIAFLDPDDWLEHTSLESLYKKASEQNCDMLLFNFNKVDESGNLINTLNFKTRLRKVYDLREDKTFNWRDIKPKVLGGLYPAAWNKIYKRDFVKKSKLHFTNSNLMEDTVFVFGATLKAKNIGYLNKNLYNYVIHNKSALHTSSDKNLCIFKSIDSVKKLIMDLGLTEDLKKEYDSFILRFITMLAGRISSKTKLKDICLKKLTPEQNKMIQERFLVQQKISSVINSLLLKK